MKYFTLITGMHRSGTSFLARALNLSGVYLGKMNEFTSHELRPMMDNERGHWENTELGELGEKILSNNNGTYDDPPPKITLDSKLGKKLEHFTANLYNSPSLASGYKDPRILLYFDSYKEFLPKNSILIGIFRSPLKVAESLKKRNGFSYEKSLSLWKTYNSKLLIYLEKHEGFLINFDWPPEKLLSELKLIFSKLGLVSDIDLSNWFSSNLLHSDKTFDTNYSLSPDLEKLYSNLQERANKNSKIKIELPNLDANNFQDIIKGLIFEIKNNESYFKKLNDNTLKLISNKQSEPISALLFIYYQRPDLQKTFPEVSKGNYDGLIEWAISVCKGNIVEDDKTIAKKLTPFLSLYDVYHTNSKEFEKQKKYTNKLESVIKFNDDLKTKNNILVDQNDSLQKSHSELKHQNDSLQKSHSELKHQNDSLQKSHSELKHQNDSLQQNFNKNTKDLENLKQEFERINPQTSSNPLKTLLDIYAERKDLQSSFPEVSKGNFDNIIGWATSVVLKKIDDTSFHYLKQHGPWYVNQFWHQKSFLRKHETLNQIYKIISASKKIINDEGFSNYLSQVKKKTAKKEFHIKEPSILFELEKDELQTINDNQNLISKKYDDTSFSNFVQRKIISSFEYTPKISIIFPVYNVDKLWLEKALESVLNQTYRNWELCIVDDASTEEHISEILDFYSSSDSRIKIKYLSKNQNISGASNEALKLATGEFVTFLDHDDEITPNALFEIAKYLNLNSTVDLIYSDDAKIDIQGKIYDFQHKPNYSPELLLSYSYFSHMLVLRRTLLENLGGFRLGFEGVQDYDLALRATEHTSNIHHIPKVLYYWRSIPTSTAYSADSKENSINLGRRSVEEALERRNISGTVSIPDFAKKNNLGIYNINFKLQSNPLVSIIIPTKDKLNLLSTCIESIENKITYPNYEIIIVDTGSVEKNTLEYLKKTKHKVIKPKMDKFSFSYLNNYAVTQTNGKYIVFMNNDIEVLSTSLLDDLVGLHEYDEKIGITGAKLIYPDKKIQHAGVIIGLNNGLAGHANKLRKVDDPGYLWYACVQRNFSAVTAALMMIRKDLFENLGGFDEKNLSTAYNDVDLCLKVVSNGYRVVYNPNALAIHHEGSTRGTGENLDSTDEENYFRKRWYDFIKNDPYYNPNLSLENENFEFKNKIIKKKILLVTHNLNYEGATMSLYHLAKEFKNRNYEILVVSPNNGPMLKQFLQSEVDTIIAPEFFSNPQKISSLVVEFDLVYLNTILTYTLIDTIKQADIPIIWCIRESEREHYMTEGGASLDHFRSVDKIVFVANATRKIYADLESNNNFVTIYNGLDVEKLEHFQLTNNKSVIRKKYGFSMDEKLVTVVGTVTERKGQLTLIKAAIKILESTSNNKTHFLLVGCREGKYLDKIKKLIEDSKWKKNFHLIPETGDVFNYYLITDIFVCTSLIESFPRIILEAMCFKLPIISTNVFGIPEQITNGHDGILIEPNDVTTLEEKLKLLLDNDSFSEKLSKNAFLTLKNNFTIHQMIQNYENLIEEVSKLKIESTIPN